MCRCLFTFDSPPFSPSSLARSYVQLAHTILPLFRGAASVPEGKCRRRVCLSAASHKEIVSSGGLGTAEACRLGKDRANSPSLSPPTVRPDVYGHTPPCILELGHACGRVRMHARGWTQSQYFKKGCPRSEHSSPDVSRQGTSPRTLVTGGPWCGARRHSRASPHPFSVPGPASLADHIFTAVW